MNVEFCGFALAIRVCYYKEMLISMTSVTSENGYTLQVTITIRREKTYFTALDLTIPKRVGSILW
jgi:hypothetical protein